MTTSNTVEAPSIAVETVQDMQEETIKKPVPVSSGRKFRGILAAGILVVLALSLGLGLGIGLNAGKTATVVNMEVVVDAELADFTPTIKTELREKIATEVGVAVANVALSVTAASVKLQFEISVANAAMATAASQTLSSKLTNTNAASTFLTTESFTAVVTKIEPIQIAAADGTVTVTVSSPSSPPPNSPAQVNSPPPLSPPPSPPPLGSNRQMPPKVEAVAQVDGGSRRSLGGLVLPHARRQLAPTSGEYITDVTEEYVEDRVNYIMATPNMVMCYMRSTINSAMINTGAYVAFASNTQCPDVASSRGSSQAAAGSQGGETFTRSSMIATMDSATSPMIAKGRFEMLPVGQTPLRMPYGYMTIHEGFGQKPPNGKFETDYAVKIPSGQAAPNDKVLASRGRLTADGNTITFSEAGDWGFGLQVDRIYVTGDTTSGSGAFSQESAGSSTVTFQFGYNGNNYCRTDGTTEKCFNRLRSLASVSTWRYGLYNADGSRFDLAVGSITVKNAAGQYGNAQIGEIWMPSAVADGDALTDTSGNAYTVKLGKMKLTKYTRVTNQLSEFAGLPLQVFYLPNADPSSSAHTGITLNGVTHSPGTPLKLYWDEAKAKFVFTHYQSSGNWVIVSPEVEYNTTAFRALTANCAGGCYGGIRGYSEAMYSQYFIPDSTISNASPGTVSNGIVYYTSELVHPGDSVPAQLICSSDCATDSTLQDASQIFTSGTKGQGATLKTASVTYDVDSTAYTIKVNGGSSTALNSDLLASVTLTGTDYVWGIESGPLFDASASLNGLECSWDTNSYCPYDFTSSVAVYYRFTTGKQSWNTAVFLKDSSNAIKKFSQPVSASFTVPTGAAFGTMAGSKMSLMYAGFGNLWGIPGKCVDTITNLDVSCGGTARWVDEFSIPTGSTVTVGGVTKYVKALESEIRFAPVSETSSQLGIVHGSTSKLPAAKSITGTDPADPSDPASSNYVGEWSTSLFDGIEPRVIAGKLTGA